MSVQACMLLMTNFRLAVAIQTGNAIEADMLAEELRFQAARLIGRGCEVMA